MITNVYIFPKILWHNIEVTKNCTFRRIVIGDYRAWSLKLKLLKTFFQVVFSRRVSLFVVRLKRKFSTTSFFFALFLKYIVYGQTSCRSDTDYLKLEAIVIKFVI